ncbi:hypothetical protein [Granulibacter bethesdensis]|uniref:hypothetical protein n=1 Tax=Granulibacter bethesdensis TaxID=364410 RepID=UPI00046D8F1F|nr:hypothetical protein [Granulibacter bethesdensis]
MSTETPDEAALIEVGETGDTFRLWCARQAVQHGADILNGQADTLRSQDAKATSMLGWSSTLLLATMGAVLFHPAHIYFLPAAGAAIPFALSAYLSWRALRPGDWNSAGIPPEWLLDLKNFLNQNELTGLESIAESYNTHISANSARLKKTGATLKLAWTAFFIGPCAALSIAVISVLVLAVNP